MLACSVFSPPHFLPQSYLSEKCAPELGKCTGFPSRTNPQVSLVTFGAVNVGDAAYVQDFNKRVNARIIDFEKDRTKQVSITALRPSSAATKTAQLALSGRPACQHQKL